MAREHLKTNRYYISRADKIKYLTKAIQLRGQDDSMTKTKISSEIGISPARLSAMLDEFGVILPRSKKSLPADTMRQFKQSVTTENTHFFKIQIHAAFAIAGKKTKTPLTSAKEVR